MINQTFNMLNNTKDLLKKKDFLIVGSFIRKEGTDIVHISKNEQFDRYRERLLNKSFSVFADKDLNNIILLNGMGKNCKEVIKIFCVPKLTKFMNTFNDKLKKDNITMEDFIKEFESTYHFDFKKIINNIIGKRNTIGKSFYEITYLDSVRFKFEKGTDKLNHVEVKFTPMLLNFIEQESLLNPDINITIFSTEICDLLMEDTGGDYEVVEEYIIEASKIITESENIYSGENVIVISDNVDWKNNSGYKIIEMDRISSIIKKVIPDYDNTTIINYSLQERKMYGLIYSHDCPTGSSFTFITVDEMKKSLSNKINILKNL